MDRRLTPLLQVWTTRPSFEGSSPEIPPRDAFLRAQTDPAAIFNILATVHANPKKPDFYLLTEPAAIAIATARDFAAATAVALQDAYDFDATGSAAAKAQRVLLITQCTAIHSAALSQMRLLEDRQDNLFGIILPISQQDHSPEVIAAIAAKNLFVMYNKAIALEMPHSTQGLPTPHHRPYPG